MKKQKPAKAGGIPIPPVVVIAPVVKEPLSFSNAPITHHAWHAIVTFTAPVHGTESQPGIGTISSFSATAPKKKPVKVKP